MAETITNLDSLDITLATMYNRMQENDEHGYQLADTFEMQLTKALGHPETFDYPFDSLKKEYLNILTSNDGRFRIFNWMHPGSGTNRHYPAVFQTRLPSGKVIAANVRSLLYEKYNVEGDREGLFPGSWYRELYRLNDSLYLAIIVGQASGLLPFEIVEGISISEKGYDLWPAIFEGEDSTGIDVVKTWYLDHRDEYDGSLPLVMSFDPTSLTISYPEMTDDDIPAPTGDTLRLKFNGRRFFPL